MPTQLQLRGGTTAEHSTFVGASRELTIDTTTNSPVIHDGITAGGHTVLTQAASDARYVDITGDTMTGNLDIDVTGALSANLDLRSDGGGINFSETPSGDTVFSQKSAIGVFESTLLKFLRDSSSEFYHNGVKKLETASDGAIVTGDLLITAAAPVSAQAAARKDYVDGALTKIANGSQTFPGGLIVQWGQTSITTPTTLVTLPIAFPGSFRSVSVTAQTDSTKTYGATIVSTSTFNIHLSSGTRTFNWIAIGHN